MRWTLFLASMTEYVFSEASGPSYKWWWKSPRRILWREYAFSFRLWQSVFSNVSGNYVKEPVMESALGC